MSELLWKPGEIKIYKGAMRTGKTTHLILDIHKIDYSNSLHWMAFKPSNDNRFSANEIRSQGRPELGSLVIPCISINPESPKDIFSYLTPDVQVVAFDELQFFNKSIVKVLEELRYRKVYVIGSLLNLDFKAEPFGASPYILSIANDAVPVIGICEANHRTCRNPGEYTQRLINGKPAHYRDLVELVDNEENRAKKISYELRCLEHHHVPGKPRPYINK